MIAKRSLVNALPEKTESAMVINNVMEEKLKNENKGNKGKLPNWILACECRGCLRLRARLGIKSKSDLNNDKKPRPGFTFSW